MIRFIKNLIPERFKRFLLYLICSDNNPQWRETAESEDRKAYVFLAGFYPNLGDMAITYAQIQFIQKTLPDYRVVAVPANKTYEAVKTIKRFIKKDDIITIIGGGNMSDMYRSLEDARLFVVKSFPKNRIVSFPQTVLFSDKRSLAKSRKVYLSHKNMTLFLREPASFERAKQYFTGMDIKMCPDIVLTLNEKSTHNREKKILVCMRKDAERQLSDGSRTEIESLIGQSGYDLEYKDTVEVTKEECQEQNYVKTLNAYWDRVKSSSFVITDRLHCMIFCVITGTPCVAFDNSNHKIKEIYNRWLSELPYISVFDDFSDALSKIGDLIKNNSQAVSVPDFSKEYEQLSSALKQKTQED